MICRCPGDDDRVRNLRGHALPILQLPATDDAAVRLHNLGPGWTVLYVYPQTAAPDAEMPASWDLIPGARGCTVQACAFRDHHRELAAAGAQQVFGLSQATAYRYLDEGIAVLAAKAPTLKQALDDAVAAGLPICGVGWKAVCHRPGHRHRGLGEGPAHRRLVLRQAPQVRREHPGAERLGRHPAVAVGRVARLDPRHHRRPVNTSPRNSWRSSANCWCWPTLATTAPPAASPPRSSNPPTDANSIRTTAPSTGSTDPCAAWANALRVARRALAHPAAHHQEPHQLGDIARAALVLTPFEHRRLTGNSPRTPQCCSWRISGFPCVCFLRCPPLVERIVPLAGVDGQPAEPRRGADAFRWAGGAVGAVTSSTTLA